MSQTPSPPSPAAQPQINNITTSTETPSFRSDGMPFRGGKSTAITAIHPPRLASPGASGRATLRNRPEIDMLLHAEGRE
ncbi:hypothetical protein VCV18_009238 [Metarhizium anisopliae]